MDLAIRVAVGALRKLGKNDLADWLENAPGKLGNIIGGLILKGLDLKGNLSPDAINGLEQLKDKHGVTSPPQKTSLLDDYLGDLKALVKFAEPYTVVALKGFFHDPNCLVALKIDKEGKTEIGTDASNQTIFIESSKATIFVLDGKTDDTEIRGINSKIELDGDAYWETIENREKDEVVRITKNDVILQRRPKPVQEPSAAEWIKMPEKEKPAVRKKFRDAKNAIEHEKKVDRPQKIYGADGINETFRTLRIAIDAQEERERNFRNDRTNPDK